MLFQNTLKILQGYMKQMEGKAARRRHRLLNVWTRKGCGSRPLPSAKTKF